MTKSMTDFEIIMDILKGSRSLSSKDLKDATLALERIEKKVENKHEMEASTLIAEGKKRSENFLQKIEEALHRKVKFVNDHKERLLEAWMAETGLLPSESEMVIIESREGEALTTKVHVRKLKK